MIQLLSALFHVPLQFIKYNCLDSAISLAFSLHCVIKLTSIYQLHVRNSEHSEKPFKISW